MPTSSHSSKHINIGLIFLFSLISIISVCFVSYHWWIANQAINPIKKDELYLNIPQPIFMDLEPFTINLPSFNEYPDNVLYIDITLRLADESSRKKLHDFLPEVRSRVLLLLSNQNAKSLSTHEGKLQLMQAIKATLSQTMTPDKPGQNVSDVLFTTFILR
ncbi:flagellar basal body-associated protein FliL [Providencia sneebia]|uniref:Flagellar protein FliL n=1 Tax=Providencia sneebia DSM 19967 TaxID=1141660 RepID=K8WD59_9GAMM|nr:flagellar basal body-associated protein FliL [Providencia sneebia]EKT58573.1 flagellar basal body-associated protein FliL [Providencia sneebia DSM 19967]